MRPQEVQRGHLPAVWRGQWHCMQPHATLQAVIPSSWGKLGSCDTIHIPPFSPSPNPSWQHTGERVILTTAITNLCRMVAFLCPQVLVAYG